MSEQILALLPTYGPLILVPLLAGAALGVPLPASLLVLAAGALTRGSAPTLAPLILYCVAAAVAGDTLGYWLGRRGDARDLVGRGRLFRRAGPALAQAEVLFRRRGGMAVLLSRCLVTPLGPVVNLVAGLERYPLRRFVTFALAGEGLWVATYAGLGYAARTHWPLLARTLGQATWVLTALALAALALGLLRRNGRRGEGMGKS